MLTKLPGWVVSNHESVERKVAPYRDMTPARRLEIVASACRDAASLLAQNPLRERVLALSDPLPASSQAALARLRTLASHAKVGRGPNA